MTPIKIGKYVFKKHGLIEFPDGRHLYLKKLNIVSFGVMPSNEESWKVLFITKESILKLKENITDNFEVVGLTFSNIDDAFKAHKLISSYYWEDQIIAQLEKGL